MKREDIYQVIADRLYYLRTVVFKMTQKELAKELDISFEHTISEFENGKTRPGMRSCQIYIKLARERGKIIDYPFLRPDQFKEKAC